MVIYQNGYLPNHFGRGRGRGCGGGRGRGGGLGAAAAAAAAAPQISPCRWLEKKSKFSTFSTLCKFETFLVIFGRFCTFFDVFYASIPNRAAEKLKMLTGVLADGYREPLLTRFFKPPHLTSPKNSDKYSNHEQFLKPLFLSPCGPENDFK